MRFLPTTLHGSIDYLWSVALLLSPWLVGFAGDRVAFWTALVLAVGGIGYSLLTDYELGLVKVIPVPVHLILDAIAGFGLVAIAWTVVEAGPARSTLSLFGIVALIASLITRTRSDSPRQV